MYVSKDQFDCAEDNGLCRRARTSPMLQDAESKPLRMSIEHFKPGTAYILQVSWCPRVADVLRARHCLSQLLLSANAVSYGQKSVPFFSLLGKFYLFLKSELKCCHLIKPTSMTLGSSMFSPATLYCDTSNVNQLWKTKEKKHKI